MASTASGWAPGLLGVAVPASASSASSLAAASAAVGIVKCGLAGLAPATSYVFAYYAPGGAKGGLALMQPVLLVGDVVVIAAYGGLPRRADFVLIRTLLLFTLLGLVVGYCVLGLVSDSTVRRLTGAALLAAAFRSRLQQHLAAGADSGKEASFGHLWRAAFFGIWCGAVSLLTNSSGPLLDMYLLDLRLPKEKFLALRSSYLVVLGIVKLAGNLSFGVLQVAALPFAAGLCLLAAAGVLVGKQLTRRMPQAAFELITWTFILLAALRLLLWG